MRTQKTTQNWWWPAHPAAH
ncbi:trp operon leader peptide [Streptomyces sp. NPDC046465]